MAVVAIFRGSGFTKAMYEALRSKVNWEGDNPKGGVFHAAGFNENGDIRVADVWESQEALEAFFTERLLPGFQAVGAPPPEAEIMPLHASIAYAAGIEPYVR